MSLPLPRFPLSARTRQRGSASTGGAHPRVGAHGSIRGANTPAGVSVNPGCGHTDFNTDSPHITAPTDGTPLISIGATVGTARQTTLWRTAIIGLTGNQSLTILADVTIIRTATSGATALSITGNAAIIISAGSSLTIYTDGGAKIAGLGLGNSNTQPVTCIPWGTNQSVADQTLQIAGHGALKSLVHAPSTSVTLEGNGDMMGSVFANYGPNTSNGVFKWREVSTAADLGAYTGYFQSW